MSQGRYQCPILSDMFVITKDRKLQVKLFHWVLAFILEPRFIIMSLHHKYSCWNIQIPIHTKRKILYYPNYSRKDLAGLWLKTKKKNHFQPKFEGLLFTDICIKEVFIPSLLRSSTKLLKLSRVNWKPWPKCSQSIAD